MIKQTGQHFQLNGPPYYSINHLKIGSLHSLKKPSKHSFFSLITSFKLFYGTTKKNWTIFCLLELINDRLLIFDVNLVHLVPPLINISWWLIFWLIFDYNFIIRVHLWVVRFMCVLHIVCRSISLFTILNFFRQRS